MSSMKHRRGGNQSPALFCAPLDMDLAPIKITSKAAVNRMGDIEHTIAIHLPSFFQLVVDSHNEWQIFKFAK